MPVPAYALVRPINDSVRLSFAALALPAVRAVTATAAIRIFFIDILRSP
jgi:hypothetical protein